MKDDQPGNFVNQAELARLLGVSTRTIREWGEAGCPVHTRGNTGQQSLYSVPAVFKWRIARAEVAGAARGTDTILDLKRRKLEADAVGAEIDVALRRGSVASIENIRAAVRAEYRLVRAKLISLGARIAPRAAVMRDAALVKALIDDEVTIALKELASDGPASVTTA